MPQLALTRPNSRGQRQQRLPLAEIGANLDRLLALTEYTSASTTWDSAIIAGDKIARATSADSACPLF